MEVHARPLTPPSLGRQVFFDLYECERALLKSVEQVRSAMLEAARAACATVVAETFHQFNPHGVSGVVVIAESHIAVHTWPEHGYVAIDFFTCGHTLNIEAGCATLKRLFAAGRSSEREFHRGVLSLTGLPYFG